MTSKTENDRVQREALIIGGGPAGLTAALMLAEAGLHTHTVEVSDQVGGISRTASYKGFRFDIGGHRFFTKVKEVEQLWKRMMGNVSSACLVCPEFTMVENTTITLYACLTR